MQHLLLGGGANFGVGFRAVVLDGMVMDGVIVVERIVI